MQLLLCLPVEAHTAPNVKLFEMKGEASLLDRYAVYTQLQQLLTPSSSNSVLQLFPPDTRAVWQALGAAAAATAAKHSRAGDAPEVQQEMALQRLQQLLEAAARGEPVSLETEAKDDEAPQLLLNKVIPQVLAHKPFTDLRSFQGKLFIPYTTFT